MHDYALVLNAGSSSLTFGVCWRPEAEDWRLESRGQIEGIGTSRHLFARDAAGRTLVNQKLGRVHDGFNALDAVATWFRTTYCDAQLVGIGHHVLHGGTQYTGPTVVTPQVLADLYRLVPLAPLHQPYNLAAIEAVSEKFPGVPQVACFDTSFHRSQPRIARVVPLPREVCGSEVQRYGFHGLSYEYVASVLPRVAPEIASRRVIAAHLGSGASVCALKDGKSIDCSLGFTALDGLCMGTRPGSLDPGVVLYLFQTLKLSAKEVETILYQKSGLLALSGISSDMRDLLHSRGPRARMAVEFFVYRAAKEIGALAAVLGGLDSLVFTGGIGEHSTEIRQRICESCAWLGVELDATANSRNGPRISSPSSKVSAWVIPTNEELMIARHTGMLLGLVAGHSQRTG
jgi:acetate kinase